jgi:hypothetical protein
MRGNTKPRTPTGTGAPQPPPGGNGAPLSPPSGNGAAPPPQTGTGAPKPPPTGNGAPPMPQNRTGGPTGGSKAPRFKYQVWVYIQNYNYFSNITNQGIM